MQLKMRKKKTSKKIIQFSMMVCGQSGTGQTNICYIHIWNSSDGF